jgi:invasion protein IalB
VITLFGRPAVTLMAAAAFALSLAAVAAPPAFAQEQPAQAQAPAATPPAAGGPIQVGTTSNDNPQPWTVNCTSNAQTGDLVCTMSQVLIASQSNQRLVGASVYRPQPSAAAIMRLSLPHGILLQKGVDVWVDAGKPTNFPIIIADQNGSYADVELGANMLVSLQGGGVLHVGVSAGSGERVEFSLSLKGFTAAFAKL